MSGLDKRRELKTSFLKGGVIPNDLFELITGDQIAYGVYRDVFDCPVFKGCVIKYETGAGNFCNIAEWEIWNNLKNHKVLGQWLAPCYQISPSGTILVQAKTTPAHPDQFPAKIPRFFTDTKYQNWGWYDGRLVCHDYANNRLFSDGPLGTMVKAKWWDAKGGPPASS